MANDPTNDPAGGRSNLSNAADNLHGEIDNSLSELESALANATGADKQAIELKIQILRQTQSSLQTIRACSGVTSPFGAPSE